VVSGGGASTPRTALRSAEATSSRRCTRPTRARHARRVPEMVCLAVGRWPRHCTQRTRRAAGGCCGPG
jgi:hypothetical protein